MSNLRKEQFGLTFLGAVHHGREGTVAGVVGGSWSHGTHSFKAEKDKCLSSAPSLLSIPIHDVTLASFIVGLLISINLI